jgi:hypothetical protein
MSVFENENLKAKLFHYNTVNIERVYWKILILIIFHINSNQITKK